MPPLSFFPWRFLLDVCCSHFFLSRPSQGVLELSDLSKMFTSSLALVSFSSLLPNKSWQRCVRVYSVTPPFQLSDTCRIKKYPPPGSNFTGGRNLLQFRWISHLWAMGKREQLFRIKETTSTFYCSSLPSTARELPQPGIPLARCHGNSQNHHVHDSWCSQACRGLWSRSEPEP